MRFWAPALKPGFLSVSCSRYKLPTSEIKQSGMNLEVSQNVLFYFLNHLFHAEKATIKCKYLV